MIVNIFKLKKFYTYLFLLRSPSLQFGQVHATRLSRVLTGCPFASTATLALEFAPLVLATAVSCFWTTAFPVRVIPFCPTVVIWFPIILAAAGTPAVATCIGWMVGAATWTTCHLEGSLGSCWYACCNAGCAAAVGREICCPGVCMTWAPWAIGALGIVNWGVAVFNIWTVPMPGILTVDVPPGRVGGEVMVVPGWTAAPCGTPALALGI